MKKLLFGVIISVTLITLTACSVSKDESKFFELFQSANGSSGSYWEYTLSNDNIIKETDYYETSIIGPGYKQHWRFQIIGEGEVTINWLAYEGDTYTEKYSYSVTYFIGENGKRKIIE